MILDFFRKDFFTKRSLTMTSARMAVYMPISLIIVFFVMDFYSDLQTKHASEFSAEWEREKAEIKAEAQRRYLAERKTDPTDTSQLAVETPEPRSTEQQPGEDPRTEVVDRVEIVTSGPLKGMTVEAAKAFANQHLADSKAAATKHHEWELRRKAVLQRLLKNGDQIVNLDIASTKRGDDKLALMLSVFKRMSVEQREQVRQDLLETESADKVKAFFDAVANAPTKTGKQLQKDARTILKSRETYRAARRELEIEYEQIQLEFKELDRTKPF